jgi:hypothetical protein
MFGSDRSRPKDYRRAVVIDAGPKNKTNEDTLRSERRSSLTKRLTEPTLLEMSGYPRGSGPLTAPVLDLSSFRELPWAGRARRSSHKARITNSRAVLQGVVNPAARVNLGPTFSTAVLGWLDHQQSPCSITSRIKYSARRVCSHSRGRRPRKLFVSQESTSELCELGFLPFRWSHARYPQLGTALGFSEAKIKMLLG